MAQLERLGRADAPTLDLALNELGRVHYGQGQLEAAEQRLARALALRRARGDAATIAVTLVDEPGRDGPAALAAPRRTCARRCRSGERG